MKTIFNLVLGMIGFLAMLVPIYPASAQELAKDQVVVYGVPAGDIGTIDPQGGQLTQDMFHRPNLFDALVHYPIGDSNAPNYEPALATKWEVKPDKLTWVFHLRKGVKWHHGFGEFSAEDVVYSYNRAKNGKTSAFRGDFANFKEVKALDKYTVQITTHKTDPYLLLKVSNCLSGFIVCKKAVEKAGAFDRLLAPTKEEAVATGRFIFEEFKPKDALIMLRNDTWWGGKLIIEKYVGKYIADDRAREMALFKGEITMTGGLKDSKWLKYMESKGMVWNRVGPIDLKVLYFNLKMKPFDDRRVREAFAYALGQEDVLKMQGQETSTYALSPIPSDMYGFVKTDWEKYIKRDPAKAKKLLAEAGYPNGLNVKMFMSKGFWYLDKFIVYQNVLKESGINLDMTIIDHAAYKQKMREGVNPIVIWGSKFPTAVSWLRNMYHSASGMDKDTAQNNYMYYANPEIDKLTEIAENTLDEKERLDALAKAQKIIVNDLPSIPSIEEFGPIVRTSWFSPGYEIKANYQFIYDIGVQSKILKH